MKHMMHFALQFGARFRAALALLAFLLSATSLYAQSCAMCYQTAANSSNQTIQALKHGILLMLFPPLVITAGICYLAYHKRNMFNREVRTPRAEFL